jgi:hypothetical protein
MQRKLHSTLRENPASPERRRSSRVPDIIGIVAMAVLVLVFLTIFEEKEEE